MPTFVELRKMVSRRIGDPQNTAVSVADVGDTINASIRFYKQKRFWFNYVSDTFTVLPNDPLVPSFTIPLLYLDKDDGLTLIDQSYRYPLMKMNPLEFDNADIGQIGRPWGYVYRNKQYTLYYTPEQAYQVYAHGVRDYDDLDDDDDTNDFTVQADRLIMFDAMSRIYAEFRQDNESAALFSQAADAEYSNLQSRTNENLTTGRMTVPDSFGCRYRRY